MSIHQVHYVQQIPVDLSTAWEFFSSPRNLQKITPEKMKFRILTKNLPNPVYPGQLIAYTVTPMLKIPFRWITEITEVKSPYHFIDEQRRGPYKIWRHQHYFREIDGGIEMTDIVHYEIPGGMVGEFIMGGIVRKKIKDIFSYRRDKIESLFGKVQS